MGTLIVWAILGGMTWVVVVEMKLGIFGASIVWQVLPILGIFLCAGYAIFKEGSGNDGPN